MMHLGYQIIEEITGCSSLPLQLGGGVFYFKATAQLKMIGKAMNTCKYYFNHYSCVRRPIILKNVIEFNTTDS